MPIKLVGPPQDVSKLRLDATLERDQGFWSGVADAFRLYTPEGQLLVNPEVHDEFKQQPGYIAAEDPLVRNNPELFRHVSLSRSEQETLAILKQVKRNNQIRGRLDGASFLAHMIGGSMTLTSLIPVPFARGFGFMRGAGRGAMAATAVIAPTEAARHRLDPTSTLEETTINIVGGALFGGALGGVVGQFTKRAHGRELGSAFATAEAGGTFSARQTRAAYDASDIENLTEGRPVSRTPESMEAEHNAFNSEIPPSSRDAARQVSEPAPTPRRDRLAQLEETPPQQRTPEQKSEISQLNREIATDEVEKIAAQNSVSRNIDNFGADRGSWTREGQKIIAGNRELWRQRLVEFKMELAASKQVSEEMLEKAGRFEARAKGLKTEKAKERWLHQAKRLREKVEEGPVVRQEELHRSIELAEEAITELDDVSDTSSSRFTSAVVRGITWHQFPVISAKNNQFSGALGNLIARTMDELGMMGNLVNKQTKEGRSAPPSVEAAALQWKGEYEAVMAGAKSDYLEYMGKPSSSPGNAVWAINTAQAARRGINQAARLAPESIRERIESTPDKVDWEEFKTHISRLIIDKSKATQLLANDPDLLAAAEKASRRVEAYQERIKKEMDELGISESVSNANKVVQRTRDAVDSMSESKTDIERHLDFLKRGDPEQLRVSYDESQTNVGYETWRSQQFFNYTRVLEDLDDKIEQVKFILKAHEANAERISNAVGVFNEPFFHRIFRRDLIEENEEFFKSAVLRPHLSSRRTAKMSEEQFEEYVDRVYQRIINTSKRQEYSGEHIVDYRVREIEAAEATVRSRLAALDKQFERQPSNVEIIEGPNPEEVAGNRNSDDYRPAYLEYKGDGSYVMRIDRAKLREDFEGKKGKAQKWHVMFDNADEFIQFVESHEYAHSRFYRGELETIPEYEARINDEAWRVLVDGEPPSNAAREQLKRELKRLTQQKERIAVVGRDAIPSPLRGRTLDIPSTDFILDDQGISFIELDLERVLSDYSDKMGPAIEMARKFGDVNMEARLQVIWDKASEAISNASSKAEVDRLTIERDKQMDNLQTVRSMVLGTHGIPDDPDAYSGRAARMLKNWTILGTMGQPTFAAVADIGNLVFAEGAHKVLYGLLNRFRSGWRPPENNPWAKGSQEGKWAGVSLELATAQRFRALTETGPSVRHTRGEELVQSATRNLFVVNLLSHWTDGLSNFYSTMWIARVFRQMQDLEAGKLSQKEIEQLAGDGIGKVEAMKFLRQWRKLPEEARQLDGMPVANTDQWDPDVARDFRSLVATNVRRAVLTPGVVDRAKIMENPWAQTLLLYKTFAIGVTNRIILAGIQGRHAHVLSGILSMLALGYAIDAVKRPDWSEPDMKTKLLRAFDQSGLGGIFTDINHILEAASEGELGLNPLLGIDDTRKMDKGFGYELAGAVGGPVANIWANLIWALQDGTNNEVARAIRYTVPYNNYILWTDAVTRLTRDVAEATE